MDFVFNEEQQELRATARSFLAENSGSAQVRQAMESELGFDAQVWKQLSELGWLSVTIPQEYDGLGLGYVELSALMEVMGESLLCSPFLSTIGLAANALLTAGSEAQKRAHLPGIAAGQTIATLAFSEANGHWNADAVEAIATPSGDGYTLRGAKHYVPDGLAANLLVIAARSEGSRGTEGISLFVLPSDTPGIERSPLPTMDQTRRQAAVVLHDVVAPASALLGPEGGGWPALRKTLDLAAIALAAEQVGGAQRCLDLSVEYAKEREQFGRPIGSFQAIKHKCADMMVQVESARSAAYYAGCVAAEDGDDLSLQASLAKAYCSDAFFRCAGDALQIFGGVGFTWEYDIHLYLKRAKSTETFLGNAAYHRELVAQQIGLGGD